MTRRVPITLTVGFGDMPTDTTVDVTMEGFPSPSPPKHYGKPYYTAVKETHQIPTANAYTG